MDSALPLDETVKTSGLKSQTSAEKRDQSMPPGWACSGKKQQLLLDRKGWMAASERNSFFQLICERQLITIIWSTSLPLASLIDIIKPLFTVLSSASINLGNIKRKIVVSTENQTRGCWVRSNLCSMQLPNWKLVYKSTFEIWVHLSHMDMRHLMYSKIQNSNSHNGRIPWQEYCRSTLKRRFWEKNALPFLTSICAHD